MSAMQKLFMIHHHSLKKNKFIEEKNLYNTKAAKIRESIDKKKYFKLDQVAVLYMFQFQFYFKNYKTDQLKIQKIHGVVEPTKCEQCSKSFVRHFVFIK